MQANMQTISKQNVPIEESLKEWRDYQDSLTDKLYAKTGSAQLELLSQDWIQSTWWDTYFLKLNDSNLFQREIIMNSNSLRYWYARTIIPYSCFSLDPAFFKRLESEPIKNLIFSEPRVQRLQLLNYPIDNQCIEFHWLKEQQSSMNKNPIWVRLAQYLFQKQHSFYIAELLFPELGSL